MNELTRPSPTIHYDLESILAWLQAQGRWTPQRVHRFHIELLQLLAGQCRLYTRNQSSSLPVERAQIVLESVCYTISIYLSSFSDMDSIVQVMSQSSAEELFLQGQKRLHTLFQRARVRLDEVRRTKLPTENQAYRDTIAEGLVPFFQTYDIKFAAQETPGSIDYPLHRFIPGSGILYMVDYLDTLAMENRFCAGFGGQVEALLRGMGPGYRDLLVNLFELTVTNLLGRVLCGAPPHSLWMDKTARALLQSRLEASSPAEQAHALEWAAAQLAQAMRLGPKTSRAVAHVARQLASPLRNALSTHTLDRLFPTPAQAKQAPFSFAGRPNLPDDAFRALAQELCQCRYPRDKLAMLRQAEASLTDWMDLLDDGALLQTDLPVLLPALEDPAAALLLARAQGAQSRWLPGLLEMIGTLPAGRREKIGQLARQLTEE